MIAKCLALLAVVAQINCYVVNSNCGVVAPGCVGTAGSSNSRNIVAKGKFPVALENSGPVPDCRVPVTTSHVQAPVQEKPVVRLPARIPAPRTVAHSCTCYKQILRPRVHDQYITVPTVQRYIETTHTPVVENIHYEGVPVNCANTFSGGAVLGGQVVSAGCSGFGCSGCTAGCLPVASVPPVAQSLPVNTATESFSLPPAVGCGCGGSVVRSVSGGCCF